MNLFHETNYFVYNGNLPKNIKICILSDLHYSDKISDEKLVNIIKKVETIEPNYIFFCGDMMDSVDEIENQKGKNSLLLWLKELGMISPLMISIGSHDYYKYYVIPGTDKVSGKAQYPTDFFDEVNSLKNVFVLNNDSYENRELFVTGYTQSLDYYYPQTIAKKTIFNRNTEDRELMKKELLELRSKIKEIPQDKMRFLLVHSPTYLNSFDITSIINEYDFFVSGHMHNGCVPPILYEIWNSKRGLITPDRALFQDNERNTLRNKGDKLIVNGPLTTFQKCTGKLEMFNFLYPSYITNLTLTNDSFYNKEKVYTKTRYSK